MKKVGQKKKVGQDIESVFGISKCSRKVTIYILHTYPSSVAICSKGR